MGGLGTRLSHSMVLRLALECNNFKLLFYSEIELMFEYWGLALCKVNCDQLKMLHSLVLRTLGVCMTG